MCCLTLSHDISLPSHKRVPQRFCILDRCSPTWQGWYRIFWSTSIQHPTAPQFPHSYWKVQGTQSRRCGNLGILYRIQTWTWIPLIQVGNFMQRVRWASFVYGTALWFILASSFHFEMPQHPQVSMSTTPRSARHGREPSMAGSFTPLYRSEWSAPRQRTWATLCTHPARTCRGKSNRSLACVTKYFCTGARTIRTNTGSPGAIHCCTTALWSPCSGLQLGRMVVNVWEVWPKDWYVFLPATFWCCRFTAYYLPFYHSWDSNWVSSNYSHDVFLLYVIQMGLLLPVY